jgi:hypothetical protein
VPPCDAADPAVENFDPVEDRTPSFEKRLHDSFDVGATSSPATISSVRRVNPPTFFPNMMPKVFKSPRISFLILMRMPTRISRADKSARTT